MTEAMPEGGNQYLTFTLGRDPFAINIALVREVLELVKITRVPRTPACIRGVINLRGRAVPVVDLKLQFGMGATAPGVDTCIIIVEVLVAGEAAVLGVLADSVHEVYEMEPSQIEPPPRMGTPIEADYILGMGKSGDRFIVILDIDRVFSSRDLTGLAGLSGEAATDGALGDGGV